MNLIREMLKADSISSARFFFELCGGRWVVLIAISWFIVELAREAPAVQAQGAERVVENLVRKGRGKG
jgi:hypothetical protein